MPHRPVYETLVFRMIYVHRVVEIACNLVPTRLKRSSSHIVMNPLWASEISLLTFLLTVTLLILLSTHSVFSLTNSYYEPILSFLNLYP